MRHNSRMRAPAVAASIALLLAACGSDPSSEIPAGCGEGPATVLEALEQAPGTVTLRGDPISSCFNRYARGEAVQIVGTSLVSAAQQLADRGEALQLGYLVGAARRGHERSGIGSELVRRLESEGAPLRGRPAYRRGLRAGLARG